MAKVTYFSIVIGTRNRDSNLKYCMKSLKEQTYSPKKYEVIVVNYGGDQKTAKLVESFQANNFKYIYVEASGRYNESRSKNIGIRHSKGEVVICTNADIIFPRNMFSHINNRINSDKGLRFYCLRKHELPENFPIARKFRQMIDPRKNRLIMATQLGSMTATGDFQATFKKSWHQLKGYDERMVSYGAMDIDMVNRFEERGIKQQWINSNEVRIFHQYHEQNKGQPDNKPNINMLFMQSGSKYRPLDSQWGQINKKARILIALRHVASDSNLTGWINKIRTVNADFIIAIQVENILSNKKKNYAMIKQIKSNYKDFLPQILKMSEKHSIDNILEVDATNTDNQKYIEEMIQYTDYADLVLLPQRYQIELANKYTRNINLPGARLYNARFAILLMNSNYLKANINKPSLFIDFAFKLSLFVLEIQAGRPIRISIARALLLSAKQYYWKIIKFILG